MISKKFYNREWIDLISNLEEIFNFAKKWINVNRAVVVERSDALVYLITSSLELKVKCSKHGLSEKVFSFCKAVSRIAIQIFRVAQPWFSGWCHAKPAHDKAINEYIWETKSGRVDLVCDQRRSYKKDDVIDSANGREDKWLTSYSCNPLYNIVDKRLLMNKIK